MLIILVAGVHSVGKTYYCHQYSLDYSVIYKSSGDIIKQHIVKKHEKNLLSKKRVLNIENNQNILLSEIKKIKAKFPLKNLLLDGHFTLLTVENKIKKIPFFFYKEIGIDAVILLERDINELKPFYNDETPIEKFMKLERNRAVEITQKLNIPLITLHSPAKKEFDSQVNQLLHKLQ